MTNRYRRALAAFKVDTGFPVIDTLPALYAIQSLDEDDYNTIRQALAQAAEIEEGDKVVVPGEPTEEMEFAGNKIADKLAVNINGPKYEHDCDIAPEVWRAMIAATTETQTEGERG